MISLVVWFVVSVILLLFVAGGFTSLVRQMQAGFELDDLFMVSLFELMFGSGLWMVAGLEHTAIVVGANIMSVVVVFLGVAVAYSHCRPYLRRRDLIRVWSGDGGEVV